MKTLIKNIKELATPIGNTKKMGKEQNDNVRYYHDAFILIEDDKIIKVGEGECVEKCDNVIDAKNSLVTPGLVDPHTHLVFGGYRENELAMKLHGKTYLEIHKMGGGINSTVKATREASFDELYDKAKKILDRMLALGVTTVEAKSGYGLDVENEHKMLKVVKKLNEDHVIDLVSTFMGQHSLPDEYKDNVDGYIDLIINEMIPMVVKENLAEFIDTFCEKDIFTAEESRRVLMAGKEKGLIPKCHSDEIETIGGMEMASDVGAISMEHLIVAKTNGIKAMAKSGSIACLLPATSFYLGSIYAPAREMIDEGVAVAFGSDFNPGSCPCNSLITAMNIGCLKYKMTPEECLTAVTLNAAAAINRADVVGSIEEGKKADIVIWDANSLNYIYYRFGDNLVSKVIKNGKVVVE
ncbi:MAG: imidazolonepropionase [Lachnospiraceae bacterium]|nr:imidazolonepropionase [Lachnospiraceae bacterium]